MPNEDPRYAVLLARCTSFGKDQLRSIRDDAMLSEVMARLELIDGMIYASDIEHALFDAAKKKRGQE
jgi:hypothetical protein